MRASLLPELLALPLLPLLIAQGRYARRVTPRLPEAAGPAEGICGRSFPGAPLSVLGVGESPVAGVGVETHSQAITAQLAAMLASQLQRPVQWQACGRNGATAAQGLQQVLPMVPDTPVDLALLAFGVNDTTAFSPASRWRSDLLALHRALQARCQPRLTIVCGVPPLGRFPALPQPLRWVMGLKAAVLDAQAQALAASLPATVHVPLPLALMLPEMMAGDGYHPSEAGCRAWAKLLATHAMERMQGW